MAQRTQLMDLPLEILFEIIALIPYNTLAWSNLGEINRHFRRMLLFPSLRAKVAATQFNSLYRLLPESVIRFWPLLYCRLYSEQLRASTGVISNIENQAVRDLVNFGATLNKAINVHMYEAVFSITSDAKHMSPFYDKLEMRVLTFFFRVLRLLLPAVSSLLRYSALKLFELHHHGSPLSFPSAEAEESRTIEDVLLFLHFECDFTCMSNIACKTIPEGRYERRRQFWRPASDGYDLNKVPNRTLLQQETAGLLPSAMMVTRATNRLKGTSHRSSPLLQHIGFGHYWTSVFVESHARTEASNQIRVLRELCERVEAEDGRYATQILQELNPNIIRPIVTQQAGIIARMSQEEVEKNLFDEIELAMV